MATTPPISYERIARLQSMDLIERCAREGEPWMGRATNTATFDGVTDNLGLGTLTPPRVNKIVFLTSFTVSCNQSIDGQFAIGGANGTEQLVWRGNILKGQAVTVPCKMMLPSWLSSVASFTCRLTITPESNSLAGSLALTGYKITDDLNFSASKVVLAIGDSLLNGTGPTKTANSWVVKLLAKMKEQADVRLINMSVSGSGTANWEEMIDGGRLDAVQQADVILYAVSVNDAGAGTTAAAYRARLEKLLAWKNKKFPNALMIIYGTTPLENSTSHSNAETLRAEAADFVSDTNSPRLKYCNLGAAFTRTDSTKYIVSDSPGNRVHPNDSGNADIATVAITHWTDNNLRVP